MKVEISIFNEDEQYYDHYGYYDSLPEAEMALIDLYLHESFTEEQLKQLINDISEETTFSTTLEGNNE